MKLHKHFHEVVLISLLLLFAQAKTYGQAVWIKHLNNPVLDETSVAWDGGTADHHEVLFDGKTFKMWYSGWSNNYKIIGLATSPDGIKWTKHSTPVLDLGAPGQWDSGFVYGPAVLYDGTTYRMWYGGVGTQPPFAIGFATSPDGIHWTKHLSNPVFKVGQPGTFDATWVQVPCVIFDGPTYQMWYGGWDGGKDHIGYATSPDGINWTRYANSPVLARQEA